MKGFIKTLVICLMYVGCLLLSSSANACTISFNEWNMFMDEARSYADARWRSPYNSNHVNTMVDWYDMDRGNWDNGWGWYAANDAGRPFLRTMNALTLIRIAPNNSFWGGGENIDPVCYAYAEEVRRWLGSAKNFSHNAIDELDGECRSGNAVARTFWGPVIDNYTNLYMFYFYTEPLVEKAGVILHEAQHATWDGHDGNGGCDLGFSCDRTYAQWNANSLQMTYMWALTRSGYSLSDFQRQQAMARVVNRAKSNFNSPPDISAWEWCVDRRHQPFLSFSSFPSCY